MSCPSAQAPGTVPPSSKTRSSGATAAAITLTLMAGSRGLTTRAERSKDRGDRIAAQQLQRRVGRTPEEEEMEFPSETAEEVPGQDTRRNKEGRQRPYLVKELEPAPEKIVKPPTRKRINWSQDPRLPIAVSEWLAGPPLDAFGKPMTKGAFSKLHGIPNSTFREYVRDDSSLRRPLGIAPGRKPIISDHHSNLLCQVAIRADRANCGLTTGELEDKMQIIEPDLSLKQIRNYRSRTFKKKSKSILKPKTVIAQNTSSRRSQCTVAQQFRWFKTVDIALDLMRMNNTGVCNKTGLSFEDVIEHFIIGADETCLQADADGNVRIIGEFGRRKHEKKVADCRASATMLRTGTCSGSNGPTVFVMKGVRTPVGYNEGFLHDHGASVGSSIQMTENAFMTDECWEKLSPQLIEGYRSLDYIKENPQWFCLEIFDGFGAHLNNIKALQMRLDRKIISVKEEGDSSSLNQAYDKFVAKSDKIKQRQTLSVLRRMKRANNFIDQWDLIHTGLAAIRYTKTRPYIWESSFKAVNLHPKFKLSFHDWCKKIEPFMMAADSFNLVTQDNVDPYHLLPGIWQAMSPEHKRRALAIFKENGSRWNIPCLDALRTELLISSNDIPAIQVAIWHAIDDSSHLDRGIEDPVIGIPLGKDPNIVEAEKRRCSATNGLPLYQLKPDGLKGTDLLDHMVGYRLRDYSQKQDEHKISDDLGIMTPMKGYTNEARDLFRIDYKNVLESSIMDNIPENKLLYAARSKLDNVGAIKSHSAIVNDPVRIERIKEKYEAIASVGDIQLRQHQVKIAIKEKEREDLRPLLVSAIKLYRGGDHGRLLTKPKIRSILYFAFGISPDKKGGKKEEWLQQLKNVDTSDTLNRVDLTLSAFSSSPSSPVIPPIVPPVDPNDDLVASIDDIISQEIIQSIDSTTPQENTESTESNAPQENNQSIESTAPQENSQSTKSTIELINEITVNDESRDPKKRKRGDVTVKARNATDLISDVDEVINNNRTDVTAEANVVSLAVHDSDVDQTLLSRWSIMVGCKSAFDVNTKCTTAVCQGCLESLPSNRMRRCPEKCPCGIAEWKSGPSIQFLKTRSQNDNGRGHLVSVPAAELSEKILKDWNLGEGNQDDPLFEDILFSLPVSCIVCNRFVCKEVGKIVELEVQRDYVRKEKNNPKWKRRDWATLRKVAHSYWNV